MPPRFAPVPRPAHGSKAPHKRRASGLGDGGPLADPVPIEEFPPPEWRTVLNSRADLGTFLLLLVSLGHTEVVVWWGGLSRERAARSIPRQWSSAHDRLAGACLGSGTSAVIAFGV
jgi:hypothetical protein